MNIYKKISAAALTVAVAMLSACSDKGYWDEAPLEPGLSFQSAQYNETLAPGANEIVIPLDRTTTGGQETVNIKFTPGKNCPTDISVPGSVTFEAGSNVANIVINIANATPPYTYAGTLEFSGEASYSGISKLTLNCPVNYTWSSIGTGSFADYFFMDEAVAVEILKADGFPRYRVMYPYKGYYTSEQGKEDWGDWIGSNGPDYVEFWENNEGGLSFNYWNTGMLYQGDPTAPIMCYPWTAFGEDSGYTGDFDMWYEPGYAVLSPIYYIPDVGSYGQQQFAVQIELPE